MNDDKDYKKKLEGQREDCNSTHHRRYIIIPSDTFFVIITLATVALCITITVRTRVELLVESAKYQELKDELNNRDSNNSSPNNQNAYHFVEINQLAISRLLFWLLCALTIVGGSILGATVRTGRRPYPKKPPPKTEPMSTPGEDPKWLTRFGILLCSGMILSAAFIFAAQQHFAAIAYSKKTEELRLEYARRSGSEYHSQWTQPELKYQVSLRDTLILIIIFGGALGITVYLKPRLSNLRIKYLGVHKGSEL